MNVELARWQFGFVTVNHFFFVPVMIGLTFLPDLDLLRVPPARQQAAIRGVTGAEYATGPPPPGVTHDAVPPSAGGGT